MHLPSFISPVCSSATFSQKCFAIFLISTTIEIPPLFSTSKAAELRPIFGMLRQIPTIILDKTCTCMCVYVLEIDRIFLVIILKSLAIRCGHNWRARRNGSLLIRPGTQLRRLDAAAACPSINVTTTGFAVSECFL